MESTVLIFNIISAVLSIIAISTKEWLVVNSTIDPPFRWEGTIKFGINSFTACNTTASCITCPYYDTTTASFITTNITDYYYLSIGGTCAIISFALALLIQTIIIFNSILKLRRLIRKDIYEPVLGFASVLLYLGVVFAFGSGVAYIVLRPSFEPVPNYYFSYSYIIMIPVIALTFFSTSFNYCHRYYLIQPGDKNGIMKRSSGRNYRAIDNTH